MPLNQEEGIQDMRKFIAANTDKIDPEYARGLFQELINKLEDAFDINVTPLLQDILEDRE